MINRPEYLEEFGLQGAQSGSLHLFQKYSKTYSIRPPNAEICGVKFIKMMKDYEVKLVVDRNRISKDSLRAIAKIFQKLKADNSYPAVSYSIKFAEVK
jgi:hypothetical protein